MTSHEAGIQEKEQLLGRSFIFEALDAQTRHDCAALAHIRHYKAGDLIFAMGSPGDSMMAIAQGSVRISMLAPTAREVVLAELTAGEVFGEIASLDGKERSADARAVTNCKLVVFERRSLQAVINKRPHLTATLIELLCARLRSSEERMMEIAFLPLPARIAKALLRVSATKGDTGAEPVKKLALSQSEISNRVGGTRENVNRCLKKWQRSGLVELEDGWLIILDRAGLEQIGENQ